MRCTRICMTEQRKYSKKMNVWNIIMYLDPYTWKRMHQMVSLIQPITCKWWHELWVWQSARQSNTAPNCFHQQKPIECWVVLQQYRIWGPGNTTWTREVSNYCFLREVYVITDHKLLVAVVSKDVTTYASDYSVLCHSYGSKGCTSYASLAEMYTLQMDCLGTTIQKAKTRKSLAWT